MFELQNLWFVVATVIIIVTIYDTVYTVLSHNGAGPITSFWTKYAWKLVLWCRYRLNWTLPIKIGGPVILLLIIAVWYGLMNLSWFIMFYNGDYSIKGDTQGAVGVLDVLYYLGSTFTTLGMGDVVPSGFPWTLITTSGALVVTVLTSLGIAYLIPVVSAVIDRRAMISAMELIGKTPADILQAAWTGSDSGMLDGEVLNVSGNLIKESYRNYVYPVLGFFYFGNYHSSLNQTVLNLYDALSVQQLNPDREGNINPKKLIYLLKAIDVYLQNMVDLTTIIDIEVDHSDFHDLLSEHTNGGVQPATDLDDTLTKRKELLILIHLEGRLELNSSSKLSS